MNFLYLCHFFLGAEFLLFSTMADMMERNALVNAQGNASQVEMLVSQATRASPQVQPIGRIDIARGSVAFSSCFLLLISASYFLSSLISDVFFDNIFTDMAFHSNYRFSFLSFNSNSFLITLKQTRSSNQLLKLFYIINEYGSFITLDRNTKKKVIFFFIY